MDASCFGLTGVCPDYSTCYLQALGMQVGSSETSDVPLLQAGMVTGDAGKTRVNLGQYPTNYIDRFTVYAKSLFDVASLNTTMNINAYFGNVAISSNGGTGVSTTLSSTGGVTISAMSGMSISSAGGSIIVTAGGTNLNFIPSTSTVKTTAVNFNVTTTDFTVLKTGGLPWFNTNSATSLTCGAFGPFASVASSSVEIATDLIVEGTIMTRAASGLVKTAGLELCGQLIKTTGGVLQLQDSTATKIIDLRGVITNGEGAFGVTFVSAANGVNFRDSAIHNNGGTAGPLVCDDVEGFKLSDPLAVLYAHDMQDPTPGSTLSIQSSSGDVNIASAGSTTTIKGDLHVDGSITATGACCTSDIRAKHNVTAVDPKDDLNLILAMPRRVAFQYTEAYQKADRSADNNVQHGFIAQELEQIMPRAVHLVNQTINGVAYSDFRKLTLDRIVPHIVGAVKQLHAELTDLRQLVKELMKRMN